MSNVPPAADHDIQDVAWITAVDFDKAVNRIEANVRATHDLGAIGQVQALLLIARVGLDLRYALEQFMGQNQTRTDGKEE